MFWSFSAGSADSAVNGYKMPFRDDTIAAIATPPGLGGIGVIKISGPSSEQIVGKIFRPLKQPRHFDSHRLYYGRIMDPSSGRAVDEVLVSMMRGPHTYTREDVAEINCHSGYAVLGRILLLVLGCGARHAEPGEFTKRAFLNGRIDLTQAEAVADVISAGTSEALELAAGHLAGTLRERLKAVKDALVDVLSSLEASIDFPDEDPRIVGGLDLAGQLEREALNPLSEIYASYEYGRVYREGVSVAIIGRPNVGKSSLLNALLEEERAIVTSVPGTTRDVIEESLNVRGIPVRVIDTAGLRESRDEIEEIGIRLTRRSMGRADLIIFVADGSMELTREDWDLCEEIRGRRFILVLNKMDLGLRVDPEGLRTALAPSDLVPISALEGRGIDRLKDAVFSAVVGGTADFACPKIVLNVRQHAVIGRALPLLSQAKRGLDAGTSPDITAIDIRDALDCMGELTGQTTPDDVLDRVFSRFCIGK